MARKQRTPQASKPGRFGKLRLYRIVYTDRLDPGMCGEWTALVWRYNREHVHDAWLDENGDGYEHDGETWVLLRVEPISRDFAITHGLISATVAS